MMHPEAPADTRPLQLPSAASGCHHHCLMALAAVICTFLLTSAATRETAAFLTPQSGATTSHGITHPWAASAVIHGSGDGGHRSTIINKKQLGLLRGWPSSVEGELHSPKDMGVASTSHLQQVSLPVLLGAIISLMVGALMGYHIHFQRHAPSAPMLILTLHETLKNTDFEDSDGSEGWDAFSEDMRKVRERAEIEEEGTLHDEAMQRADRRAKEKVSTQLPPGAYCIGDPCALVNWTEYADAFYESEDGMVQMGDHIAVGYYVAQGNGTYVDNRGFRYTTSSQLLAIIPHSAVTSDEIAETYGQICIFEEPVTVSRNSEGLIRFGTVLIDTGNDGEDLGDIDVTPYLTEDPSLYSDDSDFEVYDMPEDAMFSDWSETRPIKLPWVSMMPAGEYFIGDPCYIFNEHNGYDWDEVAKCILRLDSLPFDVEGQSVLCYPVSPKKDKDIWTYQDEDGHRYEAPSGFLAMIPTCLMRRQQDIAESGIIYAPKQEVRVGLSEKYTIKFGDIIIETHGDVKAKAVGHVGDAGLYFIGDPCRAFDPDYGFNWESIGNAIRISEDDTAEVDGQTIFAYYTLLPTGSFSDQFGQKYRIDSGILSVIPYDLVSDVPGLRKYGRIVEFDQPFGIAQDEDGFIQVGPYGITTSEEEGKEEYTKIITIDRERSMV